MNTKKNNSNPLKSKAERTSQMVSKAFRKCVELVEEMLRKGYTLQTPSSKVERLIKIGIGADKRTVKKYVQMLTEDLAFLKAVAKNRLE